MGRFHVIGLVGVLTYLPAYSLLHPGGKLAGLPCARGRRRWSILKRAFVADFRPKLVASTGTAVGLLARAA